MDPAVQRAQPASDAELLAFTSVDAEAFGCFYRRYERPIVGYLMGRVRDPELAADLASEVFAAALEAAGSFNPDLGPVAPAGAANTAAATGSASGWLFTIAHNTLASSIRRGKVADAARRRLGMREPLSLDDEEIERVLDLADAELPLEDLLAGLPRQEREAIVGRVLGERDYADIARELGCSTLVARKRVSRGLARLRRTVADREDQL